MKKIFFLAILIAVSIASFSQSDKYVTAMKKNIDAIDSSFSTPANLLSLANNFERIGDAEKNQWLPFYYAAYCQVTHGFMEPNKDKVDAIADKATELIAKADSLSPKNSEISCIKSMIATCHLIVDPQQRYMEYGAESSNNIDKAMEQDSTNPRPFLLKGQSLRYTPENFGGGCAVAKPVLQTSLDKYVTFKSAGELYPAWGKSRVEQLMKECK